MIIETLQKLRNTLKQDKFSKEGDTDMSVRCDLHINVQNSSFKCVKKENIIEKKNNNQLLHVDFR